MFTIHNGSDIKGHKDWLAQLNMLFERNDEGGDWSEEDVASSVSFLVRNKDHKAVGYWWSEDEVGDPFELYTWKNVAPEYEAWYNDKDSTVEKKASDVIKSTLMDMKGDFTYNLGTSQKPFIVKCPVEKALDIFYKIDTAITDIDKTYRYIAEEFVKEESKVVQKLAIDYNDDDIFNLIKEDKTKREQKDGYVYFYSYKEHKLKYIKSEYIDNTRVYSYEMSLKDDITFFYSKHEKYRHEYNIQRKTENRALRRSASYKAQKEEKERERRQIIDIRREQRQEDLRKAAEKRESELKALREKVNSIIESKRTTKSITKKPLVTRDVFNRARTSKQWGKFSFTDSENPDKQNIIISQSMHIPNMFVEGLNTSTEKVYYDNQGKAHFQISPDKLIGTHSENAIFYEPFWNLLRIAKAKISNREYICRIEAAYFQVLVSNTPLDEDYIGEKRYKVKKSNRAKYYKNENGKSVLRNAEDIVKDMNVRYEEKYYPYKHIADQESVRADWCLFFGDKVFKAWNSQQNIDADRIMGDVIYFSPHLFEKKDDRDAQHEIASVLYQETLNCKTLQIGFDVHNLNPRFIQLEYGQYDYGKPSRKPFKGQKYLHGVKDSFFVYQAPLGIKRTLDEQWQQIIFDGKRWSGYISKVLGKKRPTLDLTNVTIEELKSMEENPFATNGLRTFESFAAIKY